MVYTVQLFWILKRHKGLIFKRITSHKVKPHHKNIMKPQKRDSRMAKD